MEISCLADGFIRFEDSDLPVVVAATELGFRRDSAAPQCRGVDGQRMGDEAPLCAQAWRGYALTFRQLRPCIQPNEYCASL